MANSMLHLTPQRNQAAQDIRTDSTDHLTKPRVRVDYSITCALLGQVGFCVPLIAEDVSYTQRLRTLLDKERWVTSQQVNQAAGSIVINYTLGLMSDYEMRSHLASLIQAAGNARVVPELVTTVPTKPLSSPLPAISPEKAMQRKTPQPKVAHSIVHAIPGRVRFRVPLIAQDPEYVQRLEKLLKADPVVISERMNSAAASIVITYQKSQNFSDKVSHLSRWIQAAARNAA